MVEVLLETMPLCLAAVGGAITIISVFTLIGKADILMGFEKRHFEKKFLKSLANLQSGFGIILGFLLMFCASASLYKKEDRIILSCILLGIFTAIYLALYFFLWFRKAKKGKK